MNWKLLGTDFKKFAFIGVISIILIGMFFEQKQGYARPHTRGKSRKELKTKSEQPWVCAHVVTEVVVAGSPQLELVTKRQGEMFGQRDACSTTAGSGRPESGCRMTTKILVRDGDNLTIEINRLFDATINPEDRNMARILYQIMDGKGTGPENEGFVDPNGQGHGNIHVAVGPAASCTPSRRR